MLQHASNAVKATISRAADEAALRGDRRIGTDHLLLGLLHDPDVAETLGVDVERARAAARDLDQAALAAIGIDLDDALVPSVPAGAGHASPTSGMRAAMARAFDIAKDEHTRIVEPNHVLQALLEREQPDPAAVLLRAIGVGPNGSVPGLGRAQGA